MFNSVLFPVDEILLAYTLCIYKVYDTMVWLIVHGYHTKFNWDPLFHMKTNKSSIFMPMNSLHSFQTGHTTGLASYCNVTCYSPNIVFLQLDSFFLFKDHISIDQDQSHHHYKIFSLLSPDYHPFTSLLHWQARNNILYVLFTDKWK